ncbi:MAG: DUF4266 domain-containing protein [Myxococcota bacterium]|nr:DUF4266 domain-containing protein [Myxococcota bacterium]
MRRGLPLLLLAAVLLLGGCAQLKPWEKELHARDDMAWDPDPLEAALTGHIQFSKEATMPGGGAGGGGCGCN